MSIYDPKMDDLQEGLGEEDDDTTLLCEHCNEPLREHPCPADVKDLVRLRSVDHHMAACRELLKVPDHEVLFEAIKDLVKTNEVLRLRK
jgi:hypothetical protein